MQEVLTERKDVVERFSARCFDLRPGQVVISAETILDSGRSHVFPARGLTGSDGVAGKELHVPASDQIQEWKLGEIRVSPGKGKAPIHAEVQFLDAPLLQN